MLFYFDFKNIKKTLLFFLILLRKSHIPKEKQLYSDLKQYSTTICKGNVEKKQSEHGILYDCQCNIVSYVVLLTLWLVCELFFFKRNGSSNRSSVVFTSCISLNNWISQRHQDVICLIYKVLHKDGRLLFSVAAPLYDLG